ncbi:lipoprotein-anchoring transpeptidase ErfK/SrfK [Rhodopseudomonas thermotolerans]|uniref:Lipoprotein-anchoring transpeptidase ErfK/SrfK n=3 Tax=Nitrobacteraceae TaxID=41294 RepID=A0A336JT32_9BRAD|nr:lipoprotein-anchoring transpeptidase ErfK/SrfK [Rhodopseudomonas pentothenatexigens]REF91386.1 lipoprotein-anchoring transpeptidase ErfK/SrfK [Rhodopseudomonas thermotolerans]SSW92718.1 lipoprotein-anchoring transpeptidase ErfK/SrfK [Rhodopseudomonas pentothenatexigens]
MTMRRATLSAGVLATMVAFAPAAQASPYWYWAEEVPIYDAPPPAAPKRHHPRKRLQLDHKLEKQIEKQAAKPQGPVVIAVSIEQQKLRVYDANGLFAETPVSTGMRGHSTPLGVFSVIQKSKYHRSNIYSGAPMPYMQRITWSGIALHAGALPGYPASHGCIRMPMAFAMKMWGWTRMGARVIVASGEVTPASFAHPLLATKKLVPDPEPMVSDTPKPANSAASGKSAEIDQPSDPLPPDELRRGIALGSDKPSAPPVRTADAAAAAITLTDASSSKPADTTDAASPARPQQTAQDKTVGKAQDAAPAASPDADPKSAAAPQKPADEERTASAPALPAPNPKQQIAAFVSGKDGKLYVRQNQTPLFDVPVTIAASDRPLGTHVFTAELDKDESVRWTAVSLPSRAAQAEPEVQRKSRRHDNALASEAKTEPHAGSAAEALDRLTIPPEAMRRIAEALTNGGSLIVSDQSIAAGETGKGTDFIIRLR